MLARLFKKLYISKLINYPSGGVEIKIYRCNPLTWILFILLIIFSPIICFLTSLSIFDIFNECWNIIKGKVTV